MKLYDISQEVFSCAVFGGDPAPQAQKLFEISKGDLCDLTAFSMCAHNGTHVDAPRHFLGDGKTVDEISLSQFVGDVYVAECSGAIGSSDAKALLESARRLGAGERILVKGRAYLTAEGAEVLARERILLFGNESQTVGPEEAPAKVHLILLSAGVVLLEGVRLSEVPVGRYFLNAAPINLGGAEGAPCRAILVDFEN